MPPAVESPSAEFWKPPPARSPRCVWLLDGLARGLWEPGEAVIWGRPDEQAALAGVYEWEWTNLIVPAFCEQAAAPGCPWPVVRIPHCPRQFLTRAWHGPRITGVCACPEPDAIRWPGAFFRRVHWLTSEGTRAYCRCGGTEDPPGSGL